MLITHDTSALTEDIIGAALEVHRHLGPGLLESSYQACLGLELELRGIRYSPRLPVPLTYKGLQVPRAYVVDLLVDERVVVEIKAVESLLPVHSAQLLTYLRALEVSCGLLINFHVPVLVKGVRRVLR